MSEWRLKREAQALAALKAALAGVIDPDDDQALRDLAEGETDLIEAIDAVMASIAEDEALAQATFRQIEQLEARKDWCRNRADRKKRALLAIMEQCPELSGLRRPFGTLFVGRSRGDVVIDSEDAIPPQYKRILPTPAPVPDKNKIRRALADGINVPGARLEDGSPYLGVRK